jgi:MFS family permease
LFDLAAGFWIVKTLRIVQIPSQAVLVYLWNPLVIVESSHGAHVDAVMVFFVAMALYGMVSHRQWSGVLSAAALAAGVLVKGWPILAAPIFLRRWGRKPTLVFATCVLVPLALFAWNAGWGILGPADGRGLFGALRIYAASWTFNSGLFFWIERLMGGPAARAVAFLAPVVSGLLIGWLAWRLGSPLQSAHPFAADQYHRRLLRWMVIPLGLYLVLAPTVHPWYLALIFSLLPYSWPAADEPTSSKRWLWPWFYFMFFSASTYLAYTGMEAPAGLPAIQTAAYIPFWCLLARAWLPEVRNMLDLSRV